MPWESGGGEEERRYGEIRKERRADGTTVQPDALIAFRRSGGSAALKG